MHSRRTRHPAPCTRPCFIRLASRRVCTRRVATWQVLDSAGAVVVVSNARLREHAPQLLLDYYEACLQYP